MHTASEYSFMVYLDLFLSTVLTKTLFKSLYCPLSPLSNRKLEPFLLPVLTLQYSFVRIVSILISLVACFLILLLLFFETFTDTVVYAIPSSTSEKRLYSLPYLFFHTTSIPHMLKTVLGNRSFFWSMSYSISSISFAYFC
jgi:hypothetical protein